MSKYTRNNQNSYKGRLPNGWLNCPEYADDLLADFILPVKVPLHKNYRNKTSGQNWEVNDVIKLQDTYGLGLKNVKANVVGFDLSSFAGIG